MVSCAGEIWEPMPGYEASYEVSSHGNVRSRPRRLPDGRTLKGRTLRFGTHPGGYLLVRPCRNGIAKTATVHRLIALAFLPPPRPDQTQINHIDGDKTNNRAENLEWCSPLENIRHAVEMGLHNNRGVANPTAKLSPEEVLEVYRRAWEGERQADISADFGITRAAVSTIKNGRNWGHLTGAGQ